MANEHHLDKHTEQTVNKIEHDLKEKPQEFHSVFAHLKDWKHHDGRHFHEHLDQINARLHRDHFLPHLEIVESGRGLAIVSEADNPHHRAIVSVSHKAPHESRAEKQKYQQLHFDGWKLSTAGGGGDSGHYVPKAANYVIPEDERKILIDQALALAGVAVTEANERAVELIVQHESTWKPNAINLDDCNARAGHPSQGLMQTIPGTFKQYAVSGYRSNICDPLSNLAAGINYAVHRYGSLQRVPGVRSCARNGGYRPY